MCRSHNDFTLSWTILRIVIFPCTWPVHCTHFANWTAYGAIFPMHLLHILHVCEWALCIGNMLFQWNCGILEQLWNSECYWLHKAIPEIHNVNLEGYAHADCYCLLHMSPIWVIFCLLYQFWHEYISIVNKYRHLFRCFYYCLVFS